MPLEQERSKDRKLLEDCTAAQEYVAEQYSRFTNRCTTPAVKMTFLNLLGEEHRIQNDLVSEQLRRGWKSAEPAEQDALAALLEEIDKRKKNAFQ